MPTFAGSNIPTPKSWDEFEDIALSAAKLRWKSPNFYRNGRSGQRQDGVDVWGHSHDQRHIGLQGKNTVGGVSEATVEKEVAAAEGFTPALDELYIVTTAKRDAAIQKIVRALSENRKHAGKFTVDILFWDDLAGDLTTDPSVLQKHYPQLAPRTDDVKAHDKALADELLSLLRSDGIIGFLDQNNMAGFAFPYKRFEPLRDFVYDWNKPEKEFLTPELEALRAELWKKADAYFGLLATETHPLDTNVDWHSVPKDMEWQDRARFFKIVNEFHSLAGEIVALHKEFVRLSRRILVAGRSP